LIPEYDRVVAAAATALAPGRRFVLLDLKRPNRAPEALVRLMVSLMRPFGVTLDIAGRRPWESISRHLRLRSFEELYFGFAYLAVGEKD
jgi:demethylmenaquinone methyltransferase/2-methoxy-6-polyprenyl-1,4-benzoquinol methylase